MTGLLRRSSITALVLAFTGSAMLAASLGCSGSGSDASDSTPVVSVETAQAKLQTIDNIVSAQGILYPIHQASISPKVTAPVRRFYVNRGSRVHRGELLAVLENADLAAGVISARGAYDQAQANYASTTSSTLPEEIQTAETSLENAKSNLDAQQKLYDSQSNLYKEGAIARNLLDATGVALTNAKSAYKTAEKHLKDLQSTGASAQQRAAKGQLESAHGQYLNATAQLGYTEIRSPINGVIADRAVYPGDVAPAGTPLLIVMDTLKVVVKLHIPQTQAVLLKLGNPATLHVPGIKGDTPAKVIIISPSLDPSSTTVEIWVEADNPGNKLIPGTSVGVSIVAQRIPNALVIPESAILNGENGGSRVMVVKPDSLAYSEEVTTGVREGDLIQILSGLQPGAEVIVSGAYGLPDKSKVKATPANQSEAPNPRNAE
jgi:HlyD family secretion protein